MYRSAWAIFLALPAAAQQPVQKWTAVVDLTIGAGEATAPELIFEQVNGLAWDAQGRIVVTEGKQNQLRVFTSAGKYVYTAGRPGAGPGDLGGVCCGTLGPDGALWVRESDNLRYSLFTLGTARATFLRSIRIPSSNPSYFGSLTWDAAKRVVDISAAVRGDDPHASHVRSVLSSTGALLRQDTVRQPPKDSIYFASIETGTKLGTMTVKKGSYHVYYGPVALRAFGPGGEYAAAVSSNYAVSWFDASGKLDQVIRGKGTPPVWSSRERAQFEANNKLKTSATGAVFPAVPVAKPVLADIGFDLDGRLWVERSVASGMPHQADVYHRNGGLVATVTWPANITFTAWAIRGRTALATSTDEDGIQRVVRVQLK